MEAKQAAAPNPPVSAVEAEVLRIRELLERNQFGAALGAAEALSLTVPENRDVLYMIAVSLRYLKKIPEAFAALERLEKHHPGFSRLFQERGHCHVAMRDAFDAARRQLEDHVRAIRDEAKRAGATRQVLPIEPA